MLRLVSLFQDSDSFSSKERSLLAFPGIWAWFHRLLGAKTNRLQTDKGSLRSHGVGSGPASGMAGGGHRVQWNRPGATGPPPWATCPSRVSTRRKPVRFSGPAPMPRRGSSLLHPEFILLLGHLASCFLF